MSAGTEMRRTYHLPGGRTIEISLTLPTAAAGVAVLECVWDPRVPHGKAEWLQVSAEYRAARDAFLYEVAQATGRDVACMEV